jgi:hypothetical protein
VCWLEKSPAGKGRTGWAFDSLDPAPHRDITTVLQRAVREKQEQGVGDHPSPPREWFSHGRAPGTVVDPGLDARLGLLTEGSGLPGWVTFLITVNKHLTKTN